MTLIEQFKWRRYGFLAMLATASLVLALIAPVVLASRAEAAVRSCSASTSASQRPLLRQGDSGSCVRELQRQLNDSGARLSVDGAFGPVTRSAVTSYQRSHRLAVDGLVGSQTWRSLVGSGGGSSSPRPPASNNSCTTSRPTLRQGSSGSCVRELQRQLNSSGARLSVDGAFGPATRSAVVSYQRSHGLSADGIVGPRTWSSLLGSGDSSTSSPLWSRASVRDCFNPTNQVWLSFDDSGSASQIDSILNTLKRKNVKAYFFMLGNWADSHPSLMNRIKAEGHLLGNHTYNHPSLPSLSDSSIRWQIRNGVSGTSSPKLLRPPGGNGAFSARLQNIAGDMGYRICYWNVDSRDWSNTATNSTTQLRNRILYGDSYTAGVTPGDMVLLHGHGRYTAPGLPSIIDGIRSGGMKLPRLR